jgi:mitochondrial enoyl-[acyl-carrier protein] reductase / trans-2-enoyl-CoA reductase
MIAAPINPSDLNMVEGSYGISVDAPAVAGNEGVGVVVAAGKGASFKEGQKVIPAKQGEGTWRTAGTFDSKNWMAAPADIPDEYSATIAVNPTAAWRMLEEFETLSEGDVILQNAGNSMVGEAVCQIAAERGIKVVSVIRSRPNFDEEVERLKALGSYMVVSEDYVRTPPFKRVLADLPTPKLALNGVGGSSATELIRNLGSGGTMVTYGGMSRRPVTVPTSALIFRDIKLRGFWLPESEKPVEPVHNALADLIKGDKLKLWMQTWEFSDFDGALNRHKESQRGRKVVLKM